MMGHDNRAAENVPSLDEAARVVGFVLQDEMGAIAERATAGAHQSEGVRDLLALTIAVIGATEHLYIVLGRAHPEQWESLERSAATFMDHYVVDTLAEGNPNLKRAVTKQRRRKLSARAGKLLLVEPDRNKRSRWAAVTLPPNAPIPIAPEIADDLHEPLLYAEERIYDHLAAVPSPDPLVLAGQVVGLLAACELLLAQLPSKQVAAFCVQLGRMSAEQRVDVDAEE